MTTKIETPSPQRISVPQGTVLQIYSRDGHGNKTLISLPGPVDVSMVAIEAARKTVLATNLNRSLRNSIFRFSAQ